MKPSELTSPWIYLVFTLAILFVSPASNARKIELSFDRLPSQQGWIYSGAVPESSVFSVVNGVLRMDGRGLGDTRARYDQFDVIEPTRPFSIDISMRIIDSDNFPDFEWVFGLGAIGPGLGSTLEWGTARGLGYSYVATGTGNACTVDTGFHDYLLTVVPGGNFQLFIDGVLCDEGPTPGGDMVNTLFFQDSAREAEALLEIRRFVFDQPAVGGSVTGMSPRKGNVICHNITTKKIVRIAISDDDRLWDCEQAGLVVNPGDKIKQIITVTGSAD